MQWHQVPCLNHHHEKVEAVEFCSDQSSGTVNSWLWTPMVSLIVTLAVFKWIEQMCLICIFTLSRRFCPKQLTVIHTYIHTLMAVAATQSANQHIRSSLGFSILPKDTSTFSKCDWLYEHEPKTYSKKTEKLISGTTSGTWGLLWEFLVCVSSSSEEPWKFSKLEPWWIENVYTLESTPKSRCCFYLLVRDPNVFIHYEWPHKRTRRRCKGDWNSAAEGHSLSALECNHHETISKKKKA